MTFTTIDYIVIGVLVIFGLVGLFRGLIKSVFSLARGFVSIIIAYFFVSPVRTFLIDTSIGTSINTKILEWIVSKSSTLASITDPTEAQLSEISETLNLPEFIVKIIVNAFDGNLVDGQTLGDAIAQSLTFFAVTVIAFVGLVIILTIVIKILSSLLNSVFESKVLKPINRILGLAFGLLMGAVIVCFAFTICSMIPSVNDYICNMINPADESFGVAKLLYNNNLFNWAMERLISTERIFG